jgi:hypothetical protein
MEGNIDGKQQQNNIFGVCRDVELLGGRVDADGGGGGGEWA